MDEDESAFVDPVEPVIDVQASALPTDKALHKVDQMVDLVLSDRKRAVLSGILMEALGGQNAAKLLLGEYYERAVAQARKQLVADLDVPAVPEGEQQDADVRPAVAPQECGFADFLNGKMKQFEQEFPGVTDENRAALFVAFVANSTLPSAWMYRYGKEDLCRFIKTLQSALPMHDLQDSSIYSNKTFFECVAEIDVPAGSDAYARVPTELGQCEELPKVFQVTLPVDYGALWEESPYFTTRDYTTTVFAALFGRQLAWAEQNSLLVPATPEFKSLSDWANNHPQIKKRIKEGKFKHDDRAPNVPASYWVSAHEFRAFATARQRNLVSVVRVRPEKYSRYVDSTVKTPGSDVAGVVRAGEAFQLVFSSKFFHLSTLCEYVNWKIDFDRKGGSTRKEFDSALVRAAVNGAASRISESPAEVQERIQIVDTVVEAVDLQHPQEEQSFFQLGERLAQEKGR